MTTSLADNRTAAIDNRPTLTHAQRLALGREIAEALAKGDMSRPSTNVEMSAYLAWCDHQKRERIKTHGCCGEAGQPDEEGICFGIGICPLVAAKRSQNERK